MFTDYKIAYLKKHVALREAAPLSWQRQSVAYLLSQSARKIPHVAGVTQFDVTPLVEYGQHAGAAEDAEAEAGTSLDEKDLFKRALRRNYSAFFLKALAHGLHHVPILNGFLDFSLLRNGGTLYKAEDINLSFTVHTKHGVVRPVVRNPHTKTLEQVAREMRDLARRARRTDPDVLYERAARAYVGAALRQLDPGALPGLWLWLRHRLMPRTRPDPELAGVPADQQLQPGEILGATCTLANIGMMVAGNQTLTAIIPPEVCMFGIGDLHLAPLVVKGKIVPRWVITMCVTMDHRAYDAGEGFPMYQRLKRYMDRPGQLYEWRPGDPV